MQGDIELQYQTHRKMVNRNYAADQLARNFPNWLRNAAKFYHYEWLGPLYRRIIKQPPAPFLVVCHSRTGSNFLLWLLASHPRILHVGEPFGAYQLEYPWVMSRIRQVGSMKYLQGRLQRKGIESAVGFKLLYQHLTPEFANEWALDDFTNVKEWVTASPDLKVIHLKRRNRLHNLVSHRLAAITKTYVLFNPTKRDDSLQIELSPEECEAEFTHVMALEQHHDAMFAHRRKLEVHYEDLAADAPHQGKRILDFLGVRQRRLQEQTVKQNVRSIREVVKNYDVLKAHFARTEWAEAFDA